MKKKLDQKEKKNNYLGIYFSDNNAWTFIETLINSEIY